MSGTTETTHVVYRYGLSFLFGGMLWLWMPLVWAAGKICSKGQACHTLFQVSVGCVILGVVTLVALGISNHKWVRYTGMFVGCLNLVMGERFFSQPTYDLFYQNTKLWIVQMAIGALCLFCAVIQTMRLRRNIGS